MTREARTKIKNGLIQAAYQSRLSKNLAKNIRRLRRHSSPASRETQTARSLRTQSNAGNHTIILGSNDTPDSQPWSGDRQS